MAALKEQTQKRRFKISSIILLFFVPLLCSSNSSQDKNFRIIEIDKRQYISMYEFTKNFNISNSFDFVTGRGKLLHKGAVAVYQVNLSLMLINNKIVKAGYPVIKVKGEVFLPLIFFSGIIDEFYPGFSYNVRQNIIHIDSDYNKKRNLIQKDKELLPPDSDRISFIIIDPGHGGKDPGAIGKGGLKEKGITLKIAKQLEEFLNSRLKNIRVILTRKSDKLIELAERTEMANRLLKKNENGIFVSIHVNASILQSISGFETYFLSQNPSNEEARATAALENNVIILEENRNKKAYNDVEHVEAIMLTTQIQKESSILANCIQKDMKKTMDGASSKGVKKADFFVLRGSIMPAVLVEVGYISNTREATRLKRPAYQQEIAQGIGNGIMRFIREYNKNIKK